MGARRFDEAYDDDKKIPCSLELKIIELNADALIVRKQFRGAKLLLRAWF
jgi:hypothetical protein